MDWKAELPGPVGLAGVGARAPRVGLSPWEVNGGAATELKRQEHPKTSRLGNAEWERQGLKGRSQPPWESGYRGYSESQEGRRWPKEHVGGGQGQNRWGTWEVGA